MLRLQETQTAFQRRDTILRVHGSNRHSSGSTSSPALGNVGLVCSRCSVDKREYSRTVALICVFLITTLLLFHSEFFSEQFDSSVAFQKLVLLLRVPVHLETVM